MIYRIGCEVLIEAEDAARATDILRDALCEVDGELDTVTLCEVSAPPMPLGWNAEEVVS